MSVADLAAAIDAIAAALNAGANGVNWQLRPETEADTAFVQTLYASTRWDELAAVPWPDEAKLSFLHEQARLQSDHYQRNYPGAALCVVERAQQAIGRFYLYASPGEFRLMDIALLPEWRGEGHGERMLRALMAVAAAQARRITLHVEPNNPAQRLYARLGFVLDEDRGVYHFLAWSQHVSAG